MRGIRKLLKIPSTYIDRTNTNEHVWKLAHEKLNEGRQNPREPIKRISDIIQARQQSLLGHVIRCDAADPMKIVSFKNEELEPIEDITRRVGRPRKKWILESMTHAWTRIRGQVNRHDEP